LGNGYRKITLDALLIFYHFNVMDTLWRSSLMKSKEFSLKIEKIVQNKKGISYMDAVLKYCEENDIDPGTIAPLISKTLKDKIEIEAQNLNFLPKTGKLPM
jgi:hypothetical protein